MFKFVILAAVIAVSAAKPGYLHSEVETVVPLSYAGHLDTSKVLDNAKVDFGVESRSDDSVSVTAAVGVSDDKVGRDEAIINRPELDISRFETIGAPIHYPVLPVGYTAPIVAPVVAPVAHIAYSTIVPGFSHESHSVNTGFAHSYKIKAIPNTHYTDILY